MRETKYIDLELLAPSFGSERIICGERRQTEALRHLVRFLENEDVQKLIKSTTLPADFFDQAATFMRMSPDSGIRASYSHDAMRMLEGAVLATAAATLPLKVTIRAELDDILEPWIQRVVVGGEAFDFYELPEAMRDQLTAKCAHMRKTKAEEQVDEAEPVAA